MRLRIPRPAPGTVWGVREAARNLSQGTSVAIDPSVIRYQLRQGKIAPAADGVDAPSAWEWAKTYEPHGDHAQRRVRGRTLVETAAAPAQATGAADGHANGQANPFLRGHTLVSTATAQGNGQPGKRAGGQAAAAPVLVASEWVERFYASQCRQFGGEGHGRPNHECAISPKTLQNYGVTFHLFAAKFPVVPLDRIQGRREVVDWMHGLKNRWTGAPLAASTKQQVHQIISTFYHWLDREHGILGPNLTAPGLPTASQTDAVLYPADARAVLSVCRDHTERTLAIILAQSACRLGELVTIRPECVMTYSEGGVRFGAVHVWGKVTRANSTGYRVICLPAESYEHLQQEFRFYGELMLRGRPLAGPLAPAKAGTRVNMEAPKTFRVDPLPDAEARVDTILGRLLQDAGVHRPGMGAHAFRRAFQSEWLENGGSELWMRRVMGHFSKNDIDDLYLHSTPEKMARQAQQFAPRAFLAKEAVAAD